jgi:DNA polymerase-1
MAEIKYELVRSAERLGHIANEILDSPATGLDIETTGLKKDVPDSKPSPFRDDIRLMSINTGKGVYVIDHYETKTLEPVVRALEETKGVKIVSNGKYEQTWLLKQYNAEIWPLFDPFRASALLTNGKKLPNDLYALYERYLKRAPPTRDLGASDWSLPLTPEQYEYSASDVTYLHDLRDELKPMLSKQGLNKVALIEFGSILPESAVELNGFPLDQEMWLALAKENEAKAAELHKKLIWNLPNPKTQMTLLGFEPDLNLNSPPQMLASLRKLGIKQECEECRGKGRTRQGDACAICLGVGIVELQNTREMTIAMFAAEFPIIKELIEYRGYDKSVSTYGPEWLRWIDPTTGRIHSSFWPFTEAGRFSSGKPNIQNLPRDKRFRKCFKAPNGKRFRLGDYSNIEMRIIAELSQDPRLLQIFRNGEDAHYVTAATLVGKAIADITAHERQQAKPVNFGFCYGMMPPKMVLYAMANYGVALSLKQSTEFRRKFFELYARLPEWHRELLEAGERTHFTRNKAGRIRYLNEDAHNEYLNTPVQGLGAEGLKASLRAVYMRMKKFGPWNGPVKMINHIHDEIITEIDDDDDLDREVDKELKEGMHEGMAQFLQTVPVVVETKSGSSWGAK